MKRFIFMALSAMAIAGLALVKSEVTAQPLDPMAQANVDALASSADSGTYLILADCGGGGSNCMLMCASCGANYNKAFSGTPTAVYETCHVCGGNVFFTYGEKFLYTE